MLSTLNNKINNTKSKKIHKYFAKNLRVPNKNPMFAKQKIT